MGIVVSKLFLEKVFTPSHYKPNRYIKGLKLEQVKPLDALEIALAIAGFVNKN